jgi:hypothetical protein
MQTKVRFYYHPLWNVIDKGHPYEPFPWQVQHVHSKVDEGYQFIILACGRRAGKTTAMLAEVVRACLAPQEGNHAPIIYIVGPNHDLAGRIFDPVWDMFVPDKGLENLPPMYDLYLSHDKNAGAIFLKNGAKIFRKSADDPKSMQGERVTAAFVEEAQDMNEAAWKMLLPALIDSNGILFTIGVPWGRNRFKVLFGLGKTEPGYYSASVPTTANPNITQAMIDRMVATMTEVEVRAHILAEWVDEYGVVFRDPEAIFDAPPLQDAPPRGPFIFGLDVGKLHDFTVLYCIDVSTMRVVYRDRFNHLNYPDQADRIANAFHVIKPLYIHMDGTGVGEAMVDMLIERDCHVSNFKFGLESKQAIIGTLIRAVDARLIHVQPDDEVLRTEMQAFEGKLVQGPGGTRVAYEAAAGAHDDTVMALALAVEKALALHNANKTPVNRSTYINLTKPKRYMKYKNRRKLTPKTA